MGSLMITAISLVAFAHGQNCTLLPGWNPSTLVDGQSRTWYQISEASYTQSCAAAAGTITCINGSIANGNTFKYPSCVPHTWANCTTPIAATHLDYKVLYKLPQATYTQTCQQLSQNLRCINGVFTGWTNPALYTRATCVDPNRAQCVDVWTNSYRDHGESLIWYTANHPALGQTCTTLQKTLTCTNGLWSWGTQSSLYTWCTDPASFTGCVDIRTSPAITVPHGSSHNAYTSATALSCTTVLRPLTCTNGRWVGNGTAQQNGLYSWCVQANTASCANVIAGTGQLLHGSFITKYTHPFAFEAFGQSCGDFDVSLQCVNGSRSGGTAAYTWCQNVSSWSCLNTWTNIYIPHLQFIYGYTQTQPSATLGCDSVKKQLLCQNSVRYSSGIAINQNTLHASCSSCILPRGGTLAEWNQITAYSITGALFPKTCAQNYSTALSCVNGSMNGNWQTYKYPQCQNLGGLVSGTDLAINESNIRSGAYLAQWASPQITILFQNKWEVGINKSSIASWFLSCTRDGMHVYTSKPITSFIVNAGTKVGVNIRISSLFTQALGKKSLICTVFPSIWWFGDVNTANNVWSGSFEIVEANRFDLALSTSIDPISKNLDAAEWAVRVQWLQNFLYTKIMNVLFPLIIVLGILLAMIGFYKIMFSSDDKAIGDGTNFIIYGVIGIIIIVSAKFIGQNIFDLFSTTEITGYNLATGIYDKLIYPFIKFAIYLVLGAMFVILLSRVITFLFGSDTDAQKKAGTLIWWNILSMIIIIWAKQIVEAIYGKQDIVINQNTTNLGEIGTGILADKNIPILYQVINYALGIASLVILVIIIIQTVKLLTKPDDPAQVKSIKNSLAYMFIGILVLGAGYLIVNFAIIN